MPQKSNLKFEAQARSGVGKEERKGEGGGKEEGPVPKPPSASPNCFFLLFEGIWANPTKFTKIKLYNFNESAKKSKSKLKSVQEARVEGHTQKGGGREGGGAPPLSPSNFFLAF